jgi:hypothetical protein
MNENITNTGRPLKYFVMYGLLNAAVTNLDYIASNFWMIYELIAYRKRLFLINLKYYPSRTKENHENLNQDRCSDRDSNWSAPKYKSGSLPLEPACSES